jgi:hypothetical protein
LAPLQPDDKDPLMAVVNSLESNWISIQEILELTHRVLTRIFVRLWPKKRADMPADDLKKLAATFDTQRSYDVDEKPLGEARGRRGYCTCLFSW